MAYNVYSLPDVKSVLYHPDVGTANLHLCGIGKITISAALPSTSLQLFAGISGSAKADEAAIIAHIRMKQKTFFML